MPTPVLGDVSMKPSRLRKHFELVHPNNFFDNIEPLLTKKARFEKTGTLPNHEFIITQKYYVEASHTVAYGIVKYTNRTTSEKP